MLTLGAPLIAVAVSMMVWATTFSGWNETRTRLQSAADHSALLAARDDADAGPNPAAAAHDLALANGAASVFIATEDEKVTVVTRNGWLTARAVARKRAGMAPWLSE